MKDKHGNELKAGDRVLVEAIYKGPSGGGMALLEVRDRNDAYVAAMQFSEDCIAKAVSQETGRPRVDETVQNCCAEPLQHGGNAYVWHEPVGEFRSWSPGVTLQVLQPYRPHAEQFTRKLAMRLPAASLFQGIDLEFWKQILIAMLPELIACFQPDSPQNIKRYLQNRKAPRLPLGYRRGLVNRGARTAMKAGDRRMTWEQAQQLAAETFDEILATPDNTLALVMQEF